MKSVSVHLLLICFGGMTYKLCLESLPLKRNAVFGNSKRQTKMPEADSIQLRKKKQDFSCLEATNSILKTSQ